MAIASRIRKHIVNLAIRDNKLAARTENRLIRFDRRATPQLIAACDDPNPRIRLRAAWALGVIGDPAAFDTVVRMCSDPDDEVAYDSRIALGLTGDSRALDILLAFANEEIIERDSAAHGLKKMRLPLSTLEELLKTLNPGIQHCALYCLSFNSEIGAIDIVKQYVADKHPDVQVAAQDAIFWLENPI